MSRYSCTRCSHVSSPAFSNHAIWSHVFQYCVYQSRVYSRPARPQLNNDSGQVVYTHVRLLLISIIRYRRNQGPDLQNILRFIIRLSKVCRKTDLR